MTRMRLQNILKRLFIKEDKKVLGRWNIDYCSTKINNKIDSSNEDHCGPCGQYIMDKTTKSINPTVKDTLVHTVNKNIK